MELCIALDMSSKKENLALCKELKGRDLWLKVGLRSFIRDGKEIVDEIKSIDEGFKIFVDLKLYDIPNTMADGAEELANIGANMITLHASSGKEALKEVVNRVEHLKNRPLIFAVSALTSFDEDGFYEVYKQDIATSVDGMSKIAYESGIDGMVLSVWESKVVKKSFENMLTLTPGIRPFSEESGDQKRVANIAQAKEAMSDFIVVGRPIYEADDKIGAVNRILKELDKG